MISGVEGRYAAALFELALGQSALDAVLADLIDLRKALNDSDVLNAFVASPLYARDDQVRAMTALLKQAGANDLVHRFVGVLASNRRLSALPNVIQAFVTLAARHRGEITASVITAHAMNDGQVARLKKAIEVGVKQDVQLETSIDPTLLGGLVVKIGSRMIDTSLRTKLNRLQSVMKEA